MPLELNFLDLVGNCWLANVLASPIIFLSVDDALDSHLFQVETYGGDSGLRDAGLLESANFCDQHDLKTTLPFTILVYGVTPFSHYSSSR